MIGDDEELPVFLAYLARFMRQKVFNGIKQDMTPQDFAEYAGEPLELVNKVLAGKAEPSHKLLASVGWKKHPVTIRKTVLVTETRYTTIERATDAEKEED